MAMVFVIVVVVITCVVHQGFYGFMVVKNMCLCSEFVYSLTLGPCLLWITRERLVGWPVKFNGRTRLRC